MIYGRTATRFGLRNSHRVIGILGVLATALGVSGAQTAHAAVPAITSISVSSVTTPSAAFTFTVTGTNFVLPARRTHGTIVTAENCGPISSTVNSTTQITVSVPALKAVATAQTLELYVETPGQGRSPVASDVAFTIDPPVQGPPPTIVSLSETSVTTPTSAFTFTVTGTNFVVGTTALPYHSKVVSVEWGPLNTTVNSATELTVSLPGIPKVKTAEVLHLYVENPDLTQSSTASELTFTINPPVPGVPPTFTALSASSVTPPVRDFSFTVTGAGFVTGKGERNQSVVYSEEYGPLGTEYNSATQLTVYLGSIRKEKTAITLHLYVQNPDGTRSAAANDIVFTIE